MQLSKADYDSILLSIAKLQLNNEHVAAYLVKSNEVLLNIGKLVVAFQDAAPPAPDYAAERAAISPEAAAMAREAIARSKGL